jgi:hypothetical protein
VVVVKVEVEWKRGTVVVVKARQVKRVCERAVERNTLLIAVKIAD